MGARVIERPEVFADFSLVVRPRNRFLAAWCRVCWWLFGALDGGMLYRAFTQDGVTLRNVWVWGRVGIVCRDEFELFVADWLPAFSYSRLLVRNGDALREMQLNPVQWVLGKPLYTNRKWRCKGRDTVSRPHLRAGNVTALLTEAAHGSGELAETA